MATYQLKSSSYTLPFSEVQKLFHNTVSFRDRCILKTLFWAGLRVTELVNLDIRDVDFQRKRLTILGKGGKVRTIPVIDDEWLNDLSHLIGSRNKGPVFVARAGKNKEIMTRQAINYVVKRAAEQADVENVDPRRRHINPHLLRHSIARWLKDKRFRMEWTQNFLGHESITTTIDLYGTLSVDEMQAEVGRRLL